MNIDTLESPILLQPIDNLGLAARIIKSLKSRGIIYIGDLVQYSESELCCWPGFGKKSFQKVKTALDLLGLTLNMHLGGWAFLLSSIDDLNLPESYKAALSSKNIFRIIELLKCPRVSLLSTAGLGGKGYQAINRALSSKGLDAYGCFGEWNVLLFPVEKLGLREVYGAALVELSISRVGDLVQHSEASLLDVIGASKEGIRDIEAKLGIMGLSLGTRLENWPPECLKHDFS